MCRFQKEFKNMCQAGTMTTLISKGIIKLAEIFKSTKTQGVVAGRIL